ncbi:DUF6221 family protein [Nocardia otitidiscaviarum]|uniref:DUF6221 family protein n=1 Tax=Nocardia otitidiscaviarum TaxID=1823 RepID=UPI0006937C45|nr:DUF6221 family protein [Nocardia otitidiscaviarum]
MTIEEFIAARLAEDEQIARDAVSGADGSDWHYGTAEYADPGQGWVHNFAGVVLTSERNGEGAVGRPVGEHMARHDPARVLRQCAALRRVAELHPRGGGEGFWHCETCHDYERHDAERWPCETISTLATVWELHPDYDPSWAVDS